jgi:putative two-component system response regulator
MNDSMDLGASLPPGAVQAKARLEVLLALARLIDGRDDSTGRHIDRLASLCRLLTQKLCLATAHGDVLDSPHAELLGQASCFHDIGKLTVPEQVLRKPGRLQEREVALIRAHPLVGGRLLTEVDRAHPGDPVIAMAALVARSHHERWDGLGYPDALAGPSIPLPARIVALCDVYDALRAVRPFRRAYGHAAARDFIVRQKGLAFDPLLVDLFILAETEFEACWEGQGDS